MQEVIIERFELRKCIVNDRESLESSAETFIKAMNISHRPFSRIETFLLATRERPRPCKADWVERSRRPGGLNCRWRCWINARRSIGGKHEMYFDKRGQNSGHAA